MSDCPNCGSDKKFKPVVLRHVPSDHSRMVACGDCGVAYFPMDHE